MENEFILVEDAAKHMGVTEKTVRNYIKRGELQAYKLGASWRIKPADLDAFIDTKSNIQKGDLT